MLRFTVLALLGIFPIWSSEINLGVFDSRNKEAVEYCGTRPSGGRAQLDLLRFEGLQPQHHVLEIGFGALMSAIPIMSFLEEGHYYGIDPNTWLLDASLKIPENAEVLIQKKPTLIFNSDFDATSAG